MSARSKGNLSLFGDLETPPDPRILERRLIENGYARVAGVDEAGRGPLAGPVVAAAVILDDRLEYPGVDDSKKLSPSKREKVFWTILRRAESVSLGLVSHEDIDRTNILKAALAAMAQAAMDLNPQPDYVLVDGPHPIPLNLPQRAVPHGDSLSLSIGAASIVAKVVRDRLMLAYDNHFPQYGFAAHKGYATKVHLEALTQHGPCPIHRLSFARVKPQDQP